MIVFQSTCVEDRCPSCGHEDVQLLDAVDDRTNRVIAVVCEDCWDETG